MSSFRIPALFPTRRSFNRLRSFHLSPAETAQVNLATYQTPMKENKKSFHAVANAIRPLPSNVTVPLRGSTLVILAVISSLFFITSISFAFIGGDVEEPFFMHALNEVANSTQGLVLIGESVDVDVDEPSITIRWSIVGCGENFILPGSAGSHGSNACGLPASPLNIFIDNNDDPIATYDPTQIPFTTETGQRRSIQNLVQFDSDHVLDVHEARLYPFDTYFLTSTLRAAAFNNDTIPIQKLVTIDVTSSFDIVTIDMASYSTSSNGTQLSSRDMDMRVSRPNEARAFTLLLFAVSWVLTHVTIGHVFLARRLTGMKPLLTHLVSSGAILVAIPQLRNSMPDAPGLDGVLIDSIGFFPQMIITGIAVIMLLLLLVCREFDFIRHHHQPPVPPPTSVKRTFSRRVSRSPASPTPHSSSTEIAKYELHRVVKHLQGEYVFPPVTPPSHRLRPSDHSKPAHRRVKTMSKIMEAGEMSHWSDSD